MRLAAVGYRVDTASVKPTTKQKAHKEEMSDTQYLMWHAACCLREMCKDPVRHGLSVNIVLHLEEHILPFLEGTENQPRLPLSEPL